MKKSSAQAWQSDSLTQSTLLSLKSLEESKLGAKGREEGSLECLGALLDKGRSQLMSGSGLEERRELFILIGKI